MTDIVSITPTTAPPGARASGARTRRAARSGSGRSRATAPDDADAHDAPPGTPQDETDGAGASPPSPSRLTRSRSGSSGRRPCRSIRRGRRAQEPVQYQAPRPQPAPQYTPQAYVPPQGPRRPRRRHASHPRMHPPSIRAGDCRRLLRAGQPYSARPRRPVVSPPAPRVSKARMGRRMMRRMVRGTEPIGKAIFGVRPGLVVAFILVLLLTGWLAYDKWLAGSGTERDAERGEQERHGLAAAGNARRAGVPDCRPEGRHRWGLELARRAGEGAPHLARRR